MTRASWCAPAATKSTGFGRSPSIDAARRGRRAREHPEERNAVEEIEKTSPRWLG